MGHGKHVIEGGRLAAETVQGAYDDADLSRAIAAYKFFYPTVSGAAIVKGNEQIGLVPNKVFGILDCAPEQLVFTANSDTPYGPLLLDLGVGPLGRRAAARSADRVLDGHQPALGGRHGPAGSRRRKRRQAPAAAARLHRRRPGRGLLRTPSEQQPPDRRCAFTSRRG